MGLTDKNRQPQNQTIEWFFLSTDNNENYLIINKTNVVINGESTAVLY